MKRTLQLYVSICSLVFTLAFVPIVRAEEEAVWKNDSSFCQGQVIVYDIPVLDQNGNSVPGPHYTLWCTDSNKHIDVAKTHKGCEAVIERLKADKFQSGGNFRITGPIWKRGPDHHGIPWLSVLPRDGDGISSCDSTNYSNNL